MLDIIANTSELTLERKERLKGMNKRTDGQMKKRKEVFTKRMWLLRPNSVCKYFFSPCKISTPYIKKNGSKKNNKIFIKDDWNHKIDYAHLRYVF